MRVFSGCDVCVLWFCVAVRIFGTCILYLILRAIIVRFFALCLASDGEI